MDIKVSQQAGQKKKQKIKNILTLNGDFRKNCLFCV
jgi:hypothetical protein